MKLSPEPKEPLFSQRVDYESDSSGKPTWKALWGRGQQRG